MIASRTWRRVIRARTIEIAILFLTLLVAVAAYFK